jgi:hypothetical protein
MLQVVENLLNPIHRFDFGEIPYSLHIDTILLNEKESDHFKPTS